MGGVFKCEDNQVYPKFQMPPPHCTNTLIRNSHILSKQLPKGLLRTNVLFCYTVCSPGAGNGNPLQYSCLENPMDGEAWWAVVHGVAKSRTRLSDFIFTFHFHTLEKEMAPHSSVLAWRIPGTEEPSGLPSLGSHRIGHDWSELAAAAAAAVLIISDQPVSKQAV